MGEATKAEGVTGGVLSGADPLDSTVALFLIQVVVIMAMTRLLASGLSYLNQPRVIAEVVAGIILGPSCLGYVPGWLDHLFPQKSLPFLQLVANIGLVLYMFLVGLELDPTRLFLNARHTVAISATGALGSIVLYQHQTKDSAHPVPFSSFLLFTGLAMSITAFPVLARILTDLNLVETEVGVITIGSAAIDDAVAWCLLILVISILNSADLITALYVFFLVAGYGLILLVLCRPYIGRYLDRVARFESETWQKTVLAFTFMAIFSSAFFTEIAGVHTIFGAFLLGLAVPSRNPSALRLAKTIEDFASIVLLPLYFAASGLRTQIGSLNSGIAVLMLIMVLTISTVGKMAGCCLAARAVKVPWREAITTGVLMNTRGLIELIVLNLGLDAKVIDPQLFTIMVLMALITTFATSPIVAMIYPPHKRRYITSATAAAAAAAATANKASPVEGGTAPPTHSQSDTGGGRHNKNEAHVSRPANDRHAWGADRMKLMLIAQRMTDVPGLALLTELLMPDRLSAVRFVESEDSSMAVIMSQGTLAATKMDPTLQMVNTCGYLSGFPVDAQLKVCKSEDFAKELCHRAIEEEANMVLLSCRRQAPKMAFLHDYHPKFVSGVIDQCSKTLLLFWNHELEDQFLTHRALGGKKRVVVIFQGGPNDREALRISLRFAKADDVIMDLFVLERSTVMTLQDQAELAHFESLIGTVKSHVVLHRLDEDPATSASRVVESCQESAPQLIVLGSSEAAVSGAEEAARTKRASVPVCTEMNLRKRQLLGKLGQALTESEIAASLLVVLVPTPYLGTRGAQKSGLGTLGITVEEEESDVDTRSDCLFEDGLKTEGEEGGEYYYDGDDARKEAAILDIDG